MRRTGLIVTLTATALAGLAAAGMSQATALPAERTITRDFVAIEPGSFTGDARGVVGPGVQESFEASTKALRKDVAETKKALAGRPGVETVAVDCGDITTDLAGPSFNPAFSLDKPPVLVQKGTWVWDVTAKQTCTFVLRR
jgi:hypothetical protein